MPLDPEAKDFLERLAAAKLPPIQEMTVARGACPDGSLHPFPRRAARASAGSKTGQFPARAAI